MPGHAQFLTDEERRGERKELLSRGDGSINACASSDFGLEVPMGTGDGAFWMGLGGLIWSMRGSPRGENATSTR